LEWLGNEQGYASHNVAIHETTSKGKCCLVCGLQIICLLPQLPFIVGYIILIILCGIIKFANLFHLLTVA